MCIITAISSCLLHPGAQPALDPDHGERGAVRQGQLHLPGGEWVWIHQPHVHPGRSRSVLCTKHVLCLKSRPVRSTWGVGAGGQESRSWRPIERVLTVRIVCVCVPRCTLEAGAGQAVLPSGWKLKIHLSTVFLNPVLFVLINIKCSCCYQFRLF